MLIRQFQGRSWILDDTRPLKILVEGLFQDPTNFSPSFSLYRADTDERVINHVAADGPDGITSEVDGCTGETVWSFFLSYSFVAGDVDEPGEYYWRFTMDDAPDVFHVLPSKHQVITFWDHG